MLCRINIRKLNILISQMESTGSQVVIIYLPSFHDEDKLREAIASQINTGISQHAIVIKTKGRGITAYVELPSDRAQQLCAKKKITVLNMSGTVKRFFCTHQIFINKLPLGIEQDNVTEYFSQFGTVLQVEIVNTKHSYQTDKTVDMRHCYIQFKEKDSASKIIYHPKRHYIKNQEIKIHKTYDIGEGEQTDKKLFIKIEPRCQNVEQIQFQLQNLFRKYSQLRERIRLEEANNSHIGVITFISIEAGEKAYKELKETTISNYKVTLRPHSSDLGLFASGIRKNVTTAEVVKAFEVFGKVFDCYLSSKNNTTQNAVIYFSNEDDAKKALAEYNESKTILEFFNGKPYITYNLSVKERKEFNNFQRKTKMFAPQPKQPQFNPYQLQPNNMNMMNMNNMNMNMNNNMNMMNGQMKPQNNYMNPNFTQPPPNMMVPPHQMGNDQQRFTPKQN